MTKAIVQYINAKLAVLNYFDKQFELVEIITRSDGQKRPAEYHHKGEYKDVTKFDKYNGMSYIRKRGSVTTSETDDTLSACGDLINLSMPLRLVAVIPRKKLTCDDKYSEDVIASTITRELTDRTSDLKKTFHARSGRISIDSYNTNGNEILSEEYSGIQATDINFKFAYIAFDIAVNLLINKNCLTKDCDGAYS